MALRFDSRASILFLDEPTSGLDPEAAKTVRGFIEELKSEGRTIFMTTHNLDEAEKLCDRVGIFQGKLLSLDSPAKLRESLFGRKVVFHLKEMKQSFIDQIGTIPELGKLEVVDNKVIVSMKNPEESNPLIIKKLVEAGADVQFVGEIRHSLEQVYLEMVNNSQRGQA